ncbi:hypothetical protein N0V93_008085 [Gnomoniopsis smithogilvyi]|uniref:Uncharacterized protein n=1 Tax=Gnomoniopsis smithogilvyi TaxID=1191159 RepID=A0A9W8YM96_9PEZI|nr:hypothetical protein N0V93_008085 [Gnomoniopsis smithogilvyi]
MSILGNKKEEKKTPSPVHSLGSWPQELRHQNTQTHRRIPLGLGQDNLAPTLFQPEPACSNWASAGNH